MKRTGLIGVVLLLCLSLSTTGCLCGRYARPCGPILGCASPVGAGVVDYVDGQPGACEADCGTNCAPAAGYGTYPRYYGGNPFGCLNTIGNGIANVGEGAVCLAASPFIFVGKIITGGCYGYEWYPNCGCSGEVYYGDNCYQQHDFCNPCAGAATTGCSRCSGGYSEGIQPAVPAVNPQPSKVSQTSFRQMQPQRLVAPPRPAVVR
ncbi:MAG: hypothetical protein LBN39_11905 [Planctomycetaceae bacterium]|nr:hypothetical protein [Planctomycetaceae bacterium]